MSDNPGPDHWGTKKKTDSIVTIGGIEDAVRQAIKPIPQVVAKDLPETDPQKALLGPIQNDVSQMPMHIALDWAAAVIERLSSDAKVEAFDLALAMNKWARGVGGKDPAIPTCGP